MANFPSSISTDNNLYIAVNNRQTTLGVGCTSSDTVLTLASVTAFPTTGYITIDNAEVIIYSGISGNTLTGCIRGVDGTTATSHSTGAVVGLTIVAAHHNLLKDEIIAIETALGVNMSNVQPVGTYIAALTGDVSATGPGSVPGTVNSVGGQSAASVATAVGQAAGAVQRSGDTMTGDLNMSSHRIHNVTDPAVAQDAATKNYVDTHGGGGGGTVNAGSVGNLTLYFASGNAVSDTYVQNGHNIRLGIAAMPAKSTDLQFTIPAVGNATTTAFIVTSNFTSPNPMHLLGSFVFESLTAFDNEVDLTAGNRIFIEDGATLVFQSNDNVHNVIIASPPPMSADRTYQLQDVGSNATFVMTDGTQVIGGSKTFTVLLQTFGIDMRTQSAIEFDDFTGTGNVNLSAPNTVNTPYSLFLPSDQGKNNSLILNDGSGNLSFATGLAGVASSAGGTVTFDASTSNTGIIVVSSTTTINGPTSPFDGQKYTFRVKNDATHSVTLATGSGNFRFGTTIPSYTNSVSLTDYIMAMWNGTDSRWDVIMITKGF